MLCFGIILIIVSLYLAAYSYEEWERTRPFNFDKQPCSKGDTSCVL